jgi:hypothetical protein
MNHKRTAAIAAAILVPSLVTPSGVASAETVETKTASAVRIAGVQYDSPGTDRGGNRSLNAEWVRIKNFGSRPKALGGWTLRDLAGHVYRFEKFRLGAGKSVKVHSGRGSDTAAHVYWGRRWYVWNNDGDKATLKNAAGRVVSVKRW